MTDENKNLIQQVQDELEYRVGTAVALFHARTPGGVEQQVKLGREAVLLKDPVDVEALAVGTTFRAPHILTGTDRLWVRTERSLLDLTYGARYPFNAVDPKKVHAVQPPAEDGE